MSENKDKSSDVVLIMPPTSYPTGPSLALGILKAVLVKSGITCFVDYADVRFVQAIGKKNAGDFCAGNLLDFLGEYIFAEAAGIKTVYGEEQIEKLYIEKFDPLTVEEKMKLIRHACKVANDETDKTVERVLERNPKAVGISSTFNQRNAAIAIFKRIKEKRPDIVTFMGGANCFGSAGYGLLKKFDCIDYVFFGESDDIFADVVKGAINGTLEKLPYGVLKNGDALPENPPHRIVSDLEDIPYPDYDDFFDLLSTDVGQEGTFATLKDDSGSGITLFVEASRGCWWGEKHACSFCGLTGKIRTYRRKTSVRTFDEIKYLTERYNIRRFFFTDCVMPKEWLNELIPMLNEYDKDIKIFTELKTSLSENQIKQLADAGIRYLQPGIESLSDHELELMHKGVTAIQNLSFLKFGKKYGMDLSWNIIFGFPGETIDDYNEQIELMPLIEHFQPPNGSTWIMYAKDNEYTSNPAKFGFDFTPSEIYKYMCPDDDEYISDIAYYFDSKTTVVPEDIRAAGEKIISDATIWSERYRNSGSRIRLDMAETDDGILIIDTRRIRDLRAQLLVGAEAEIYRMARHVVNEKYIYTCLEQTYSEEELSEAVKSLISKKLMVRMRECCLALAIDFSYDEIKKRDVEEFESIYRKNRDIRAEITEEINEMCCNGSEVKTAEDMVIGKYARAFHMCFNADDFRKYAFPGV